MKKYITGTGIEDTDLQGFSLLDTIRKTPIPGILTLDTLRLMDEIVENPNIYFRSPNLDFMVLRDMFTSDQVANCWNDAFLNEVCHVADVFQSANKVIIIVSYKEVIIGRLGVAYITVPTSEINTFQRNSVIDQLLESL